MAMLCLKNNMNLNGIRRSFTNAFKSPTRIALYSVSREDNRGRQHRRKRDNFNPNVGIRHQLKAMTMEEDEEGSHHTHKHQDLKLKQMNLQLKDLDIDENNYDEMVFNSQKSYDKHLNEEEWRRKCTIHNIMKRKYFKEPPEPCFLTMAAKEQLRFLRETDPETWTYEKLAESFPITLTGVKKLLKNEARIPRSEGAVVKHDRKVLNNWKMLKAGQGGPIATAIQQRLLSGTLNIESMTGINKLPMPTEDWRKKYLPASASTTVTKTTGEFERIIKGYKDLVQSKTDKTRKHDQLLQDGRATDEEQQEELYKMATLSSKLSEEKGRLHTTFEQFKGSLKRQLIKSAKTDDVDRLQDWMKKLEPKNKQSREKLKDVESNEVDILDVFSGKVEVFKDSGTPDVTWDTPRGAKSNEQKEAYLYDPEKGYQRPYGRFESVDKIEIPPDKRRRDGVYQKDDCFYDESGDFLYRVPHLKTSKD